MATPEFLDDERFNLTFTLPAGADGEQPLHVTYSDSGSQDRERVVLLCGPLLGSRYLHVAKDKLAKEYGVRIINIDRPGFGGTTEIEASNRVRVWLEIVPPLLKHLDIQYVSIICQSGGIIYALNTLLYLRHLLHPARPYVAICAPWIHPVHSGVSLMRLAAVLPYSVLCRFDRVAHFFTTKVGWSSNSSTDVIGSGLARNDEGPTMADIEEQLRPHMISRVYNDNVRGLSEEALLLLKRTPNPDCWGLWVDYDGFVPLLADVEKATVGPPLRVDVFYAESDIMIGTGTGPRWFDDCWEKRGHKIQYNRHVVPGVEHDRILDLKYGIFEQIIRAISGLETRHED